MRIKPYISYSQMIAFESGQYKRIYIDGYKLDNQGIRLGKKFAEFLEGKENEPDEFFEEAKSLLPVPEEREKVITELWDSIPIMAILDGFDSDLSIHEYKTGKTKWTQNIVDKAGQLTFYACAVYIHTGKLPSKITLYWLPAENGKLIGDIQVFETSRTMTDIIKFYPRVKKAWIGIEKLINELI